MQNQSNNLKLKPIVQIMMTPVIDIMMIMLLFFMIAYSRSSSHFYAQKVELPSSASAQEVPADPQTMEISVDSQGNFILENRVVPLAELKERLATGKAAGIKKVIIRGDEKAPYERIILVIDQIRGVGISRVLLLTRKKNPNG